MRPLPMLALLVACTGTAPDLITPPDAVVGADLSPAEFPGAATFLSGFDERVADTTWQPGDQMLFGLRLRKGASTKRWLLHMVVAPPRMVVTLDGATTSVPFEMTRVWNLDWGNKAGRRDVKIESEMLPVNVTVAGEDGAVLGSSKVDLPAQLLGRGILRAVEVFIESKTELEEDGIRSFGEALFGLMSLLEVLQHDKVLADYFWQVVEKPGVWSVLTSLGVKAGLRLDFQKSVLAASLPPHLPPSGRTFVAPMLIDVNGNPALRIDIVVTDPARPLGLSGGMVAIAARHPTQGDLRLDAVLLAARLAH